MDSTPTLPSVYATAWRSCARAPSALAKLLRRALRNWWEGLGTDEMTAYLSQSADPIDYEYRVRRWNENAGRDHLPLP
jgi:hypothetical protein